MAICISHKEVQNLTFIINLILFFKNGKKIKNMILRYLVSFFTKKNEIRIIIETLKYTSFAKKVIKMWIIENSSPVTGLLQEKPL